MFYIAFLPIATPTRINKHVSHSRPGSSEKYLNVLTNGINVLASVHYLVLWSMMISYLVTVGLPGTRYSYSTRYSVFLLYPVLSIPTLYGYGFRIGLPSTWYSYSVRIPVYKVLGIPTPYGYRYTGRISQHPRKCFMCIQHLSRVLREVTIT